MPVHTPAAFPAARLRRLRRTSALRDLVAETAVTAADLIWPVFIREGRGVEEPIPSMPGVSRLSLDVMLRKAAEAHAAGVGAICLFPYTDQSLRTEDCAEAWNPENLTNRAIRLLKAELPDMAVMTDIALDPYNANGHDGFVVGQEIVNDETVAALVKMALAQCEAGADILGPSDMMDGRIGAIRHAVESAGYQKVAILSYAAKFASGFYGPFRDAVGASGRLVGDKKTYQVNPANRLEALRCVARDLDEGADMVMVKPGMPYLDICRAVKDEFGVPTFAYQVSGEYAMLAGAIERGWLGEAVMLESLLAFKRAGCDGVLTYFAPAAAKALRG
ncbi:porphobilinogen synthase [Pararhodobacter zhoushanensis]|uniref:Delta-aminolevulinic acid dehydratase n=1 Tax=Pararhodobacter zhoushanensis TaxID=2479545 RepID=A0ABT3H0S7_9RHOB|nr:porphobilinogen synthase [Pararhodobacter zhoushanensis]MCW1933376.1 porphobilinogen synthase [Pararhodobacter zhoushanensis]